MNDLISRKSAINAIENTDVELTAKEWDELTGAIMSVPFAEPEPQWIPVTKQLPEQDQICLVCGKKGGVYVARFWTNGKTVLWTKTGTGKFVTVIAWMPLPEPYRGDSE